MNEFRSTNHIFLENFHANPYNIQYLILQITQLEILQIKYCLVYDDFYEMVMKYCENLRKIDITYSDYGFRTNGKLNWLLQVYSKLECLEMTAYPY